MEHLTIEGNAEQLLGLATQLDKLSKNRSDQENCVRIDRAIDEAQTILRHMYAMNKELSDELTEGE